MIVSFKSTGNWGQEGQGTIKIKNDEFFPKYNWKLNVKLLNFELIELYNLNFKKEGDIYIISGKEWNETLNPTFEIVSNFSYSGSSTDLQFEIISGDEEVVLEENESLISSKKIIGYFTEWSVYQREFSVEQIQAKKLTHISYAFMLPNPSEEDLDEFKKHSKYPPLPYRAPPVVAEGIMVFHDEYAGLTNIRKLQDLKKAYPHLKVGISVGGWTLSWTFSKIAANNILRGNFISSAVDFIIAHGFDYLSLDWEFPGKQGIGFNTVDEENDNANLVRMLRETREYMDEVSPDKRLEITAAAGCNPDVLNNYRDTEPYLDSLELMSYDYSGSWNSTSGHLASIYHDDADKDNSNMFNLHFAVEMAKSLGFPSEKICAGVAFYGRGWDKIIRDNEEKIYGKAVGSTSHTLSGDYGEPGMSSYRDIREAIDIGEFKEYYDEDAKAAWCVDDEGCTISFENVRSVREKTDYVVDKNLGGFLIWELSDDVRDDGEDSLLGALNDRLKERGAMVETLSSTPEPTPEPVPELTPEPNDTVIEEPNDTVIEEPNDIEEPVILEPIEPVVIEPIEPVVIEPIEPVEERANIEIIIKNYGDKDIIIKSGEGMVFIVK